MPVNSIDFLKAAIKCLECGSEIDFRNAISRAYYAMYHETLVNLTAVPNYLSNGHAGVINYLQSTHECKNEPYDTVKLKSLAFRLAQLRKMRNDADYNLETLSIEEQAAKNAIKTAQAFFVDWQEMKDKKCQ